LTVATAAGAGGVVWLVSGLPVLAVVAAVAVPGVPWLLAAGGAERRAIARVEAIGEWTRRLRDVAATGTGLQSAIISAAGTAPPVIAEPVGMLAARLHAGADPRAALRGLADEINDPIGDQIVAALLLHLADRGDRLGAVLSAITNAAGMEVAMRKEADAERGSARFTIRFMVIFTVVAVAVTGFAGDYMVPYASPVGQLVMVVLAAGFVAVLVWVRALSRPAPVPRMFDVAGRGGSW
jgi:pilus assembly protein TadC